jgi:tRNA/rRNA methyltransferase
VNKANIYFILDGSQLASNVAQAGRAMGNFGFHNLRLVNPLNLPSAERMARGGAEVVRTAGIYTDLQEALADLQWVIGTTGKDGIGNEELVRPETAMAELATLSLQGKVGIVFGCEHHGLTNAQLRSMDRLAHVPTQPDCASINLAQSVTLFAWELEKAHVGSPQPLALGLPSHEKKQQLFIKLDRLMSTVGVLDSGRKRTLSDGIRMFFNRQNLNGKDLGFLLRTFNLFQKHLDDVNAEAVKKP